MNTYTINPRKLVAAYSGVLVLFLLGSGVILAPIILFWPLGTLGILVLVGLNLYWLRIAFRACLFLRRQQSVTVGNGTVSVDFRGNKNSLRVDGKSIFIAMGQTIVIRDSASSIEICPPLYSNSNGLLGDLSSLVNELLSKDSNVVVRFRYGFFLGATLRILVDGKERSYFRFGPVDDMKRNRNNDEDSDS